MRCARAGGERELGPGQFEQGKLVSAHERRHYNLHEIHAAESPLRRYTRLTVGEKAGLGALLTNEIVLGLSYWVPGIAGFGIRRILYSLAFRGLGRKAYIGHHVVLRCPRQIALGAGVTIDDYVQLVATTSQSEGIRIGDRSFVRSFTCLNSGPPEGFIHIGDDTAIGQGSVLYGNGGLTIGNHVLIAGQCFLVASSHTRDDRSRPMSLQGYHARGIVIEDDVWIGAGAKILDGVRIGAGAIVGANAVVNRDVPPGVRVGGVPARPLRRTSKE